MSDAVNHPKHYGGVPGIECIEVVEHFPFCRGNAIKYLWRAGAKGDLVEDLRKAIWYIQREIDSAVVTPSQADRQPPTSASGAKGGLGAVGPGTTKHPDLVTHHEGTDEHG